MLQYKNTIEKKYGIQINNMQQMQGGWSALAYMIKTAKEDFFLKVYEKNRHTAKEWINKINEYMPVVIKLRDNDRLRRKMTVPVLTVDGQYKVENDDYIFILFPFVAGNTPGSNKLTEKEQDCLAKIVAELHAYKESDFPLFKSKEDFNINICEKLSQIITNTCLQDMELHHVLSQYNSCLLKSIEEMKKLAQKLSGEQLAFVLCHTDLHGWNLLQAEQLVLLDWEGLKFAPAEADLFSFSEGFFFDYAWKIFSDSYQKARPNYAGNQNALTFYRLRRRLEDILDFARGILFDDLSEDEKNVSLDYLKKECAAIQQFYK